MAKRRFECPRCHNHVTIRVRFAYPPTCEGPINPLSRKHVHPPMVMVEVDDGPEAA